MYVFVFLNMLSLIFFSIDVKMSVNVVKRSEFVYTTESRCAKGICYYYYYLFSEDLKC